VVAYPFALMVVALSSYTVPFEDLKRRAAFLWGALATLVWFALLSFATELFWITPVFPWIMVIATVAVTFVLHGRLERDLEPDVRRSVSATSGQGLPGSRPAPHEIQAPS
jgi:hypothetical protein